MSVGTPDRRERERALDPATSFIVQAPAGSGKTELLIQRYLVLLARVERPEEIVAITFTRKAAAEMRKRIFDALQMARATSREPDEDHERTTWRLARAALEANDRLGWRLEENAARLRVQTIDALCVSLTRRMPITSRFGAQPESLDDATAHYYEAARNVLLRVEASEDDRFTRPAAHLLAHLDNNAQRAVELIAGMLEKRDYWLHNFGEFKDRAAMEAALVRVRLAAAARCRALYPDAPGHGRIEDWEAFAQALLTKDHQWRKSDPLAQRLKDNEALRQALEDLLKAPPPCYTDEQWEALEAIIALLPLAVAELRFVFAAHGQCDFVEVGQGALAALGDAEGPSDLLLALDYRIRHILVDEFQDTSRTQNELLERLTEGWEPGDGRTLFLVGDPQQSIYRFRQADVGLFLEARRAGIGSVALEPLTLRANFRSQPGIVRWVNETFSAILPAEEDIAAGAVPYSDSIARPAPEGPEVVVHPFYGGDRRGEAERVAALVAEARARNPRGTIAILVRARPQLDAIVPQLRAAGLRFRAVEIELLGQRPVVQDLLAITRALSHLGDRTAWLSVLRAPWCGLGLADFCALGSRGLVCDALHDEALLATLAPEARQRLVRTRDILAHGVTRRLRTTLRDAVESAWLGLGGPACVEDDTDLEDARIFLDFLEANEEAGAIRDPAAFERRLEKLYAAPDLGADETLQVMTVHKAKGLEFDTVILPGLGSGKDRDDARLFLWLKRRDVANARDELLVAPVNAAGTDDDPIYKYIRRAERVHGEHESGRLLYVAATRARTALHLCADALLRKDGPGPRGGSLLSRLWPRVAGVFVAPEAKAASEESRARTPARQELRRLAMPFVPVPPPPAIAWDAPVDDVAPGETIEFSWAGETARRIGTVTHRWLQRIAEDGLDKWHAEKVSALKKVLRANLAAAGVGDAGLDAAVDAVQRALLAILGDERGRWILGAHAEARNEHRLTLNDNGVRRSFIVDRHFVAADGTRWIVDYKTSRHEGTGADAFLDRERERYREQLSTYARLFPAGSRQGLYFPLVPGWREL